MSAFVTDPWPEYLRKMEELGIFGDHVMLTAVALMYRV